jgi:hypothetical protein
MKIRRKIILGILSAALTGVIIFVIIDVTRGTPFLRRMGITSEETTSFSVSFLEEIRDLYTFNTVEYIYKTVFPHDYLPPQSSLEKTIQKIKSAPEEERSDTQKMYLQAYTLSREFGIENYSSDFIVLTIIVRGGFDLSGTVFEDPSRSTTEEIAEFFSITEEKEGNKTIKNIYMQLPRPAITDVIIEDIDPEKYLYPDLNIDAEEWKKLSLFTRKQVTDKVIKEGILEKAETNGEQFIRTLLHQAGYNNVFFQQTLEN